jgi:hypothetical protein
MRPRSTPFPIRATRSSRTDDLMATVANGPVLEDEASRIKDLIAALGG